jgi:hypothetical protein
MREVEYCSKRNVIEVGCERAAGVLERPLWDHLYMRAGADPCICINRAANNHTGR